MRTKRDSELKKLFGVLLSKETISDETAIHEWKEYKDGEELNFIPGGSSSYQVKCEFQ